MVSPAPISSTVESLEAGERVLRQPHRGGRNRDRIGADAGVRAGALGGGEGLLEQAVELAAEHAGIARGCPRLLHLAEDLRFAQHQRIEAGRNPEQVAHRIAVAMPVKVGVQVVAGVRMAGQPLGQRAAVVVGVRVQFGAVAGGQQHRLMHLRQPAQGGERGGQCVRGKRHLLAQGDRRGLVVDAEDVQAHRVTISVQVPALSCRHDPILYRPGSRRESSMPMPHRFLPRLLLCVALLAGAAGAHAAASPQDPLEASIAGEFALQAGQLPEAARQYLQAARSASDPVLAERATRIALLANEDALARESYGLWQSLAPEQTAPRQAVAATLALRAGDRRAARRELQALMRDGNDGWKHVLGALIGAVGQQPKLVVAMLDDLVEGDALPNKLEPWLGFGGLAQRLEQPALVERIIEQVVARFPGEPRVALLRAQLLREGGKLAEARPLLAGLEDAARLSPQLRWSLAGEYDALGDPAQAAEVLSRGPQDEVSYAQRAALLDKAKDKAGLATLYEELKGEATSPNPMRRLLLGQVAELLARYQEALAWYANVPGEEAQGIARLRSANVLFQLQRKAQAFEALRAIQSDASLDEAASATATCWKPNCGSRTRTPPANWMPTRAAWPPSPTTRRCCTRARCCGSAATTSPGPRRTSAGSW